ncbi:MFS transporter [Enterococcus sp. 22-H-5-01]|uniref:MFS transporter n=1 Tax=Enterococcus sp. 22-H-5-01 TaxID=3418555 RepID=UPI003D06CD1D
MKEKKIFYGWIVVLGCVCITATVVPMVMSLANVYLLSVTEDMAISRSAFTLVNTITQSMGIIFSPIVAKKLATGDLKKIQTIALIAFVGAYFSFSFATSVWQLYLLAIVLGIAYTSSTLIPVSMMITNWFEEKRGLAMSIAMAGIGLGGFIFSPVLSYLLTTFGWRASYRIMAILLLAITIPISLFVLKKSPSEMGLQAYGATKKAEQTTHEEKESTLTVHQLIRQPVFLMLVFGIFCNGLLNSGSLGQFPPALEEMHGVVVKSSIISLYSLVGIFGKLILGWIDDRFGTVKSTIFGCGFMTLAFILLLNGHQLVMIYLMAFCFGLGTPIGTVSPPLITARIYGRKHYAEVYGIISSISQVGLTLGSLIIASIYDKTGSYQNGWKLLIVLTIITMITWILSMRMPRKKGQLLETE